MHPGIYLSFRSGGAAGDFSVGVSGELNSSSICVLCFDSFSFNKIDETNLLQEVHWFYSHLTFFREEGKGEKFVFFVLG